MGRKLESVHKKTGSQEINIKPPSRSFTILIFGGMPNLTLDDMKDIEKWLYTEDAYQTYVQTHKGGISFWEITKEQMEEEHDTHEPCMNLYLDGSHLWFDNSDQVQVYDVMIEICPVSEVLDQEDFKWQCEQSMDSEMGFLL